MFRHLYKNQVELGVLPVEVRIAGVVDWSISTEVFPGEASPAIKPRLYFLSCRLAPTGKRFLLPQKLHPTTKTSAHGLLLLLSFSIRWVDVWPGMRTALHVLHKLRFKLVESRT